jgi:hypothetical protein
MLKEKHVLLGDTNTQNKTRDITSNLWDNTSNKTRRNPHEQANI